ncbi:hypothetical protein R4Z10_10360 [Niallia sp. XMNu-256]|uniref:hypothetical protein n=1 Tax=Niallia sp. XMNu-256 TaxID=3082444 RepID=UPI0030CDD7B1
MYFFRYVHRQKGKKIITLLILPVSECECSAIVNNPVVLQANICFDCELKGSTVTNFPGIPSVRRTGQVTAAMSTKIPVLSLMKESFGAPSRNR